MALCDSPSVFFVEELLAAYPDVKVILVQRDFDAWMKSFDLFIDGLFNPGNVIFSFLDRKWMGRLKQVTMGWARGHFNANSAKDMKTNSRETYERHYANVRKLVPKERLLEYELGRGWKPLCDFLGKKIPREDFPRVNESEMFAEKVHIIIGRTVIASLTNILMVGGGVAVVGWAVWWQFKGRE